MAHCIIDAAEQILDKEFPVLDKGFVRMVDYLGSDARIVQAARVSYGAGTKTFRQDKALVSYLLRNGHTSPFEQVNFTFHIKMPIFVARQWIRHRTARVNEISGRYSILDDEAYMPDANHISMQSPDNKQGRLDTPVDSEMAARVQQILEQSRQAAFTAYHELLDLGIAKELARIDLPLSLYTQWYWQMDLHNLLHFLALRLDSHAQYEIRMYAEVILEIVRTVCPMACAAFDDQIRAGQTFSGTELDALRVMLVGGQCPLEGRERELFEQKLGYSVYTNTEI